MSSGYDSTLLGVEKVTWNALVPGDRALLEEAWKERDQRLCQACGVSDREIHLLTCAACGNNRIRRIYYCSRDCQKLDWESHKKICGRDFEGPEYFGVPKGKSHHSELKRERELWRWLDAMRPALTWATSQALRTSPSNDNDIRCLNFRFETDPSKTLGGSFYLVRVSYNPLSEYMRELLASPEEHDKILGFYAASLDRRIRIEGMITPDSPSCNKVGELDEWPSILCPQWPWILSHVAFFKTYDRRIVIFLTGTLCDVVSDYQKIPRDMGIFDRFIVPPFTDAWMVERFWEWEALMRNVIYFDPNGPPKRVDEDPNTEIS